MCEYRHVADGSCKVSDHETLVISQVPVVRQLRLARQLENTHTHTHTHTSEGNRHSLKPNIH